MEPLIRLADAALGYGKVRVLDGVTLEVYPGDYLGIVGPNGSGKTTLLKAILGLIRPLAGSVQIPSSEHIIGYVPQRDTLDTIFPLTVLDIVLMGLFDTLSPIGRPARRHIARAEQALEAAGIADLRDRHFGSLSGGQKQRTIIARALVADPKVLLLDEPTNGMDLPGETGILSLIRSLHDERNLTVLLVSHLLNTVINHARRIAFVANGRVETLDRSEVIASSKLSDIYGMDVEVTRHDHRYLVLPAANEGGQPA
ncbi:MAG: ABC transporter ATP-binding protein [Chthonomonadales bacterium]|nr:ABC transporter ATP-binding protein [Chthonomonadales bacterium]